MKRLSGLAGLLLACRAGAGGRPGGSRRRPRKARRTRGSRRSTTAIRRGTPGSPNISSNSHGEIKPTANLPHVDAASQQRRAEHLRQLLQQLNAIPAGQLSAGEQVNAAVFRTLLENNIAQARFRLWEMPFNSDSSFWTYLDSERLNDAGEFQRYIGRMREIPRYFDEQIANMRAGLARGFSVPRATLEGRDASISVFLVDDPRKSAFYKPFESMPRTMPAEDQVRTQGRGGQGDPRRGPARLSQAARLLSERISAEDSDDHRCPRRARRRRLVPGADSRIYDDRPDPRGNPPARAQAGRRDRSRDAADDARGRVQGLVRGVPQIPQDRPAIPGQDAGRADGRLGLCRQAHRQRHRRLFRPSAATAVRDHPGPRRARALLHRRAAAGSRIA